MEVLIRKVQQGDANALVEERKLTQAGRQGLVFVDGALGEYLRVRMEGDDGSGVIAVSDNLHRGEWLAL